MGWGLPRDIQRATSRGLGFPRYTGGAEKMGSGWIPSSDSGI